MLIYFTYISPSYECTLLICKTIALDPASQNLLYNFFSVCNFNKPKIWQANMHRLITGLKNQL